MNSRRDVGLTVTDDVPRVFSRNRATYSLSGLRAGIYLLFLSVLPK